MRSRDPPFPSSPRAEFREMRNAICRASEQVELTPPESRLSVGAHSLFQFGTTAPVVPLRSRDRAKYSRLPRTPLPVKTRHWNSNWGRFRKKVPAYAQSGI